MRLRRIVRAVVSPFTLASLACLVLAGWALWTGGLFEGPIARQVRTSSVYAAPGVDLDVPAAEQIIGNRRLIVLFLDQSTSDPAPVCDSLERAADGVLVLALRPRGDGWNRYGCAMFPGGGELMTIEATIGTGIQQFGGDPLSTVKVVAVNYDRLVKTGLLTDGPRTINPYLPRYLIAGAAVSAVVLGSLLLWLTGRRAARAALDRRERLDAATDDRVALSAAASAVAQQIIDLDAGYRTGSRGFRTHYAALAGDYVALLGDLESGDDAEARKRVDRLAARATQLAALR
ncbi:hypothetical protein [Actinoplanes sp. NBRC 101535]|uniref:hypothetical protein n=1 Tax=Actinoplanes sp. NBRC 101535 TaxID=3032196 RepID=UPI00249FCE55|nr:hypothetical protein [Actinoplanes sp. NBRC 101535]GLY07993.1 hypothetical protein Acsp01_83720 [Actinoplanes sp. NBRC 101535]